jgi:xylulose-5-phosphate/fructose-6-phosphate phosphoketolase
MGGPSELSQLTDDQIAALYGAPGLFPIIVDGFDGIALAEALASAFIDRGVDEKTPILVFKSAKGATMPQTPQGLDVVGTPRAHKVPFKCIRTVDELAWLNSWLSSYRPEEFFDCGKIVESTFAPLLPRADLLLSRGTIRAHRTSRPQVFGDIGSNVSGESLALTDVFCEALLGCSSGQRVMVTSPDEISSNRLTRLRSGDVFLLEYLSEHQCLAWCIGAATAGRPSWFTSYEAFATIVISLLTQHLKHLDNFSRHGNDMPSSASVSILLTSLGWRNVYSHQDPGLMTSLIERRFSALRCYLPASPEGMRTVVNEASGSSGLVNCISVDKYPPRRPYNPSAWTREFPLLIRRSTIERPCRPYAVFIGIGDYLLPEVALAAEALDIVLGPGAAIAIVLEELTWLYRSDGEAVRKRFQAGVGAAPIAILATSLYSDVLDAMFRRVLTATTELQCYGFRPSGESLTAVGGLLHSECTWIQLAIRSLSTNKHNDREAGRVQAALGRLGFLLGNLQSECDEAYEDPIWYDSLHPGEVLQDLGVIDENST